MTPRLIVFSDFDVLTPDRLLARFERIACAAKPKSVLFVLRDRTSSARLRLEIAVQIRRLTRAADQLFGVAERMDLVKLTAADFCHLGERDLTTAEARRVLGGSVSYSRACHDPDQAGSLDADAVVLSPILEARKRRAPLGLSGLARAREKIGARPQLLYALGGITEESAPACLGAGADGVAVVGAALRSEEPERLLEALDLLPSSPRD